MLGRKCTRKEGHGEEEEGETKENREKDGRWKMERTGNYLIDFMEIGGSTVREVESIYLKTDERESYAGGKLESGQYIP